jgi:Suppressor of fused protein (SUFU)
MADAEVLAHAERYLGPRTRVAEGGIAVHASPSMVTAVTDGLPPLGTPLPLEFACSLHPEFEAEAVQLVRLFADLSLRSGTDVEYDDGYLTDEPLVAGTAVHGLLAAPHPYADEMFNLFRGAAGELRLQFVTLVPITDAEGRYLAGHETGELAELWQARGTDLLDLRRASAV